MKDCPDLSDPLTTIPLLIPVDTNDITRDDPEQIKSNYMALDARVKHTGSQVVFS